VLSDGQAVHEVRTFGTSTRELGEMADWLASVGCTHVAMESTGVYWKPAWHVLEGRFELVLANAMYVRNIPGRKSDVEDAVWISDLLPFSWRPRLAQEREACPWGTVNCSVGSHRSSWIARSLALGHGAGVLCPPSGAGGRHGCEDRGGHRGTENIL